MKWIKIAALTAALAILAGCANSVVGRVGGKEIKQRDVDRRIAVFKLFSPSLDASQIARAEIVDQLLEEQMLVTAADEKGIGADEEMVQKSMEEMEQELKTQFGDGKKVDRALQRFNLKREDLKAIIVDRSKIQGLYTEVTKGVNVTTDEAAAYYQQHLAEFNVPEQVRASHILVKEEKLAAELEKRLQNGEDFADLARQYSIDGSSAAGGDLGYFAPGAMVPEFNDAAFSTPVGSLSPVIKTQFGYHIIKIFDKKPAHSSTFDEVKDYVLIQLENEAKNREFLGYVERLKLESDPENLLSKDNKQK